MGAAESTWPVPIVPKALVCCPFICFLRHLAEFTGHHDLWHGITGTDSQSCDWHSIQTKPHPLAPGSEAFEVMQSENPPNVKQIPIDPMLPESEIFLGVKALLSSVPFMNPAACARASKPHNTISSPSFLAELNVNADARAS